MTCKNCGHNNPAGRLRCEQCNAPLQGSMIAPRGGEDKLPEGQVRCQNCTTLNVAGALRCIECNAPLQGSVIRKPGARSSDSPVIGSATVSMDKALSCARCGYPNLLTASVCVQCKAPLPGGEAIQEPPPALAPVAPPPPKTPERVIVSGTVNPWMRQAVKAASFCLQPLARPGEEPLVELTFSGESAALNREALEPTNMAITGKQQATIYYENGQWLIRNDSQQQTTFIRVDQPVALKTGDVVLMGDRLFEFLEK